MIYFNFVNYYRTSLFYSISLFFSIYIYSLFYRLVYGKPFISIILHHSVFTNAEKYFIIILVFCIFCKKEIFILWYYFFFLLLYVLHHIESICWICIICFIAWWKELLLRIPMHEIAAICYIKDDKQHILAVKFGESLNIFWQSNLGSHSLNLYIRV